MVQLNITSNITVSRSWRNGHDNVLPELALYRWSPPHYTGLSTMDLRISSVIGIRQYVFRAFFSGLATLEAHVLFPGSLRIKPAYRSSSSSGAVVAENHRLPRQVEAVASGSNVPVAALPGEDVGLVGWWQCAFGGFRSKPRLWIYWLHNSMK